MTPPYTTGLKVSVDANTGVWKDAGKTTAATLAGDQVYTWADLSGNGFDLVQATAGNRPLYEPNVQNTLPVIRFGSLGVFTNLAASGLSQSGQAQTIFLVCRSTARNLQQVYVNQSAQNFYQNPGYIAVNDGTNTRLTANGTLGIQSEFQLITLIFDTTTITFRQNGGGTGFQTTTLQAAANTLTTFLLGSTSTNTLFLTGDIGEVLAYNAVISGANLTNIENYLLSKWGIIPNYSKLTPLVVVDGTSISAGLGMLNNNYESPALALRSLLQTVSANLKNYAVSGSSIADLTNRSAAVDALYSSSRAKNLLIVEAGTNDLALLGHSVATTYADLVAYCQARRTTGWRVIVTTMLPRQSYSETNRQAFNLLIRTNWPTFSDGLLDWGNDVLLGAAGAQNNTTLFQGDTIHPASTGQGIMAAYEASMMLNFTQTHAALAGGNNPTGGKFMVRRSITEYATEADAIAATQTPGIMPQNASITPDITDVTKFRIYSNDVNGTDAVNAHLVSISQPVFWEATPGS